MLKQSCVVCKVVGALAIIGALNWALVGLFNHNLVTHFLGNGTTAAKIAYGLIGLSGLALLASYFMVCPACKKS